MSNKFPVAFQWLSAVECCWPVSVGAESQSDTPQSALPRKIESLHFTT